ncbi:MAG: SPOR domain-containing protein [Flavobacteriaceae bacterium]|nr:SPOR domain-containing protein [Flavobacteriaceae bacterium]
MKLANYISDLLYRYECVIVPEFGGFVTNNKSAKIDPVNHTLSPPYKQITFNNHLKNNDGLLANYIASADKITYEAAINFIKFEIQSWLEKLKSEDIELEQIGTFSLENDKLIFEPQQKINYLTSSFGLNNVVSHEIKRETFKKQVVKLEEKAPIQFTPERKKAPNYLKYAAIFVIGLSAIGFGGKLYNDHQNKKLIVAAKKHQKIVEQKIESATFVISKPLPTLNLEIEKQKKNFHVIAGAFRFPENADKKVKDLLDQGYDARILGVNKWNLTVVSYGSYTSREEAYEILSEIKSNVARDSWLLIQEF